MLFIKSIIYLLFFCFLTSCANSVIENAPWNNTPVPVVYSIISPNETVQVYLNRTFNQNFPSIKNPYPEAKVFMCGSDSSWIELTRLSPDTCIFEDIKKQLTIEKGKTYSLKVELTEGNVYAHTTVISVPALITDVNCVFTGKTDISFVFDSLPKNYHIRYDTLFVNNLTIKYLLPDNSDYEILFSSNSNQIYGSAFQNQGNFQLIDFETLKDSTSFLLGLTTIDPYFKRYRDAQSINSVSSEYSYNSPVLALIHSFGGVLPQFSNIVNGVGLFGNSVTDSKRVYIKTMSN